MDPSLIDTKPIADAIGEVDNFASSSLAAPAASDLRTANTELRKLPDMINALSDGMTATKTKLDDINSRKSGLLAPVNAMVATLTITREVSSLNAVKHGLTDCE